MTTGWHSHRRPAQHSYPVSGRPRYIQLFREVQLIITLKALAKGADALAKLSRRHLRLPFCSSLPNGRSLASPSLTPQIHNTLTHKHEHSLPFRRNDIPL